MSFRWFHPNDAKVSSTSCLLPSRCQSSQLPVAKSENYWSKMKLRIWWKNPKFPPSHPWNFFVIVWLSLVGYFDLTLVNKVSPKQTCLTLFHPITLSPIHVDVTLACDDVQIRAHKLPFFMEDQFPISPQHKVCCQWYGHHPRVKHQLLFQRNFGSKKFSHFEILSQWMNIKRINIFL